MSGLSEIIDIVLDGTVEADPRVLADHVYDSIPAGDRDTILRELLPGAIGDQIRRRRHSFVRGDGAPPRSSRWDQASTAAHGLFDQRVACEDGWKLLRDTTADDLEWIAVAYDRRAEDNAAAADRHRRLAKAVVDGGVVTVGELPVAVVEEAYCG